jgi:hypothetical protein
MGRECGSKVGGGNDAQMLACCHFSSTAWARNVWMPSRTWTRRVNISDSLVEKMMRQNTRREGDEIVLNH